MIKCLKFGFGKDNCMAINQLVFETTIESLIRLLIFAALSKIILIKI